MPGQMGIGPHPSRNRFALGYVLVGFDLPLDTKECARIRCASSERQNRGRLTCSGVSEVNDTVLLLPCELL